MTDYAPLIAHWPAVPGATTGERLAALNRETAAPAGQIDVPIGDVVGYLSLRGLLAGMEDFIAAEAGNAAVAASRTAARELLRITASPHVSQFKMSDPTTYAMIAGMLDALIAAGLLTAGHKADLLALAAPAAAPWWQANGYLAPINGNDLDAAGGLS